MPQFDLIATSTFGLENVVARELRDLGYVDGQVYADDYTSNYFFSVERVLSEASTWFTMEPGDCIHTGTAVKGTDTFPKGNIGIDLREYAVTDVEIDGLGYLSNPISVG